MSDEIKSIVQETTRRLFEAQVNDDLARSTWPGGWSADAWTAVEDAGLPLALLSDEQGGFGLEAADAFDLMRIAAAQAAPLPMAETMAANWLLAQAGLPLAEGPASFAIAKGGALLRRVAWAGQVECLVVVDGDRVHRLTKGQFSLGAQTNAYWPRWDVTVDLSAGQAATLAGATDTAFNLGALMRVMEMAGALQRIVDVTVSYANDRVQFGKPIGKFQAIQQQMAVMATHMAAANAAADMASEAFGQPGFVCLLAAAKARAGEAAGIATTISHQVLGAIGFTAEHRLHLFTRALAVWRDEFGSDRYWQQRLGAEVIGKHADDLWAFVVNPAAEGNKA